MNETNCFELLNLLTARIKEDLEPIDAHYLADGIVMTAKYKKDGQVYAIIIKPEKINNKEVTL